MSGPRTDGGTGNSCADKSSADKSGADDPHAAHRRERSGGIILCGGLSSRMGFEKARLRFPGGSLLERVLGRMRQVASPVVLSLAHGQTHPQLPPGVLAVEDSAPELGPLQGLLDGFRALSGQCDRVLVMAVDMPFFTPPWMTRLLDGLGGTEGTESTEGYRACMFEFQGFANALTAAYQMALLPKLERLVSEGSRRPIFLSRDEPAHIIPVGAAVETAQGTASETGTAGEEHTASSGGHPLADVDTPESYRAALLHEGVGSPGGAPVTVDINVPGGGARARGFAALYAVTAGEALENALRLYPECAGVGNIALPEILRGDMAHFQIMRIGGDGNTTALGPETRLDPGDRLLLSLNT